MAACEGARFFVHPSRAPPWSDRVAQRVGMVPLLARLQRRRRRDRGCDGWQRSGSWGRTRRSRGTLERETVRWVGRISCGVREEPGTDHDGDQPAAHDRERGEPPDRSSRRRPGCARNSRWFGRRAMRSIAAGLAETLGGGDRCAVGVQVDDEVLRGFHRPLARRPGRDPARGDERTHPIQAASLRDRLQVLHQGRGCVSAGGEAPVGIPLEHPHDRRLQPGVQVGALRRGTRDRLLEDQLTHLLLSGSPEQIGPGTELPGHDAKRKLIGPRVHVPIEELLRDI